MVVHHLHEGSDANSGQEGDDQHRDGTAQERLGVQKPPIRRFGD
jgi:hypothetical protein